VARNAPTSSSSPKLRHTKRQALVRAALLAPRRSDEDIVAEALKLINPPSGQRKASRSEILTNLKHVRAWAQAWVRTPSPSEQEEQLERYLKNLRAAKRTRVWSNAEFLTHLNDEIARIKSAYDFRVETMPKSGKRWDCIALAASAAGLLSIPDGWETLTEGGPWHCLSMLFYEAVTGEPNCDRVLKYMAVLKSGRAYPEIFRGW
jgi:hypothetical protein